MSITGYGGSVSITGIEQVNMSGSGVGNTLTVTGTIADNTFTYQPLPAPNPNPNGLGYGNFSMSGVNTQFGFAIGSSNFTINGGGTGITQVIMEGTAGNDQFALRADTRTATLATNGSTGYTNREPVTLGPAVQVLTAQGLGGQDTFTVTANAGTQFPTTLGSTAPPNIDNLRINVDGTGGNNDALVVQFPTGLGLVAANEFAVVDRNADLTSGIVRTYYSATQWPDINYTHIQTVSPTIAASNLLVMGPDVNEPNESVSAATFLGSGEAADPERHHLPQFQRVPRRPGRQRLVPGRRRPDRHARLPGVLPHVRRAAARRRPDQPASDGRQRQRRGVGAGELRPGPGLRQRPGGIPCVAGQSYYLRVYGTNTAVVNGYNATIVNTAPPVPYNVELSRNVPPSSTPPTGSLPPDAPNDDSGRSEFDNVTNDTTPRIYFNLDDGTLLNDLPGNGSPSDAPAGCTPIAIPYSSGGAGYRVAIFDAANTQSPVQSGYATPVGSVLGVSYPGLYYFDFTSANALSEGLHNITCKVQMIDPEADSGFGGVSSALALTIDVTPPQTPPTGFATADAGLAQSSDSGVTGYPTTNSDQITNCTTPTFTGSTEANAIVRLYALDSERQPGVPRHDHGRGPERHRSHAQRLLDHPFHRQPEQPGHLDHPGRRPHDRDDGRGPGRQRLRAGDHVDLPRHAGSADHQRAGQRHHVDLQPVQLEISGRHAHAHAVGQLLVISVSDNPARATNFLYGPLWGPVAQNPGNYQLVGENGGVIAIKSVTYTPATPVAGSVATGTVTLTFYAPLPDDRYTLTVDDSVVDQAGNKLDGESNASEPNGQPIFPTGDGVPGGNFVGKFTVNSRAHIGAYSDRQRLRRHQRQPHLGPRQPGRHRPRRDLHDRLRQLQGVRRQPADPSKPNGDGFSHAWPPTAPSAARTSGSSPTTPASRSPLSPRGPPASTAPPWPATGPAPPAAPTSRASSTARPGTCGPTDWAKATPPSPARSSATRSSATSTATGTSTWAPSRTAPSTSNCGATRQEL